MKDIKNISIIGGGCVGTLFAKEFYKRGYNIVEIISRRKETAEELAQQVDAKANYEELDDIDLSADLYILSVKDEVIMEMRKKINVKNKIIVHTSGSMQMEVLKKSGENFGILYPLQTIIREREIDITSIPFFIEANNEETRQTLFNFAKTFTEHTVRIPEEKRVKLHMAAVFASNFTNYLFKISKEIMDDEGLDFELLQPLAKETFEKVFDIGPELAQTGPARRGDCTITDKHIGLLKNEEWKKLYKQFSDLIREDYKDKKYKKVK
jgi:predicted short-subunit dehydrogenase-like oxidoreductase (DUF2520 family)